MKDCCDIANLAALVCILSKLLTNEELAVLSSNLVALGDMLDVVLTQREG